MVKEIRKFWTQIKSKQTVMGAMIIGLMIAISAFSFATLVPETVEAGDDFETEYETQASTDFAYYKQITIESDYINTDLAEFPILVHDDTGDLAGKVLANGSDIAFYANGNATQYNHEIENYTTGTGELWAWVNITSLSSSTDTILFMYYGDSDGGLPVGHNPTHVWDVNYTGVYHMNESTGTTCYDSTANENHGTYKNSLPNLVTGVIANAQDFDSAQKDNVSLPIEGFSPFCVASVELWYNADANDVHQFLFVARNDTVADYYYVKASSDTGYEFVVGDSGNPIIDIEPNGRHTYWESWGTTAGPTDDAIEFINGSVVGTDTGPYTLETINLTRIQIGGAWVPYPANGVIDEVRISNMRRNDSWLYASFNSTNLSSGFVTLGTEQTQSGAQSSFSIKGLINNRITWAGTAGTTVYCNSTGDYNEWLEINMSINSSDNVTEIRVFMDDLNVSTGLTEWVNASNITMYVSNSTNSTYHSFGTFSDGGSNISINQTTWTTYIGAYNPFNGSGLTDTNTSLYLIFKVSIPSSATTNIFYTLTATANKIYLGHYE